jgi:hypothetical protein
MTNQWKTTFSKTGFPTRELWAHDGIGREHIATFTTNQEDNAAFIVTACNSHAELLANIDAVLYTVEMNRGDLSGSARQALDNLRAVVNKARGES